VPDPLLLITAENEFLMHFPSSPPGFQPSADGYLMRTRQFQPNLQAAFPPFVSQPAVIVIGQPASTTSLKKTIA
jgi:hypothetical protein